jgi:periplasmic divalent cation tolerance protein
VHHKSDESYEWKRVPEIRWIGEIRGAIRHGKVQQMGMENAVVVLCTFPDIEQARQIGAALVERQVAACVNLLPGVESIYRWEGKVERAGEVLGIIKTTRYADLEAAIRELHPYEVPEVLALEVAGGSSEYLKWMASACEAISK